MKSIDIVNRIKGHNGQMLKIIIESPVATLKSVTGTVVVKRSELFVTAGTEYANRREIREAIEAGERGEVQPLPWGTWLEYPYTITHTPKDSTERKEYVRLFPPTEAQLEHFNLSGKVQFFANGQPIERTEAVALCGSKAAKEERPSQAFSVAVSNIVSLG